MGLRLAGAILLAALLAGFLAGCTDTHDMFGSSSNSDFAMAQPQLVAEPPSQAMPDPYFRLSELRIGLTKTQLEAMYPGRLALDSSDAHNALYFVEPTGLEPRSVVERERLVLWVTDGRLATFDVMQSQEPVAVANVAAPSRARSTGSITTGSIQAAPMRSAGEAPRGQVGVQIAAARSEADARALIDTMRAKYPTELGKLAATVAKVSLPDGEFYRVIIGPLAGDHASQLCDRLKAQGAQCFLRKV
jgi:sporulation related protein